VIFIRNMREFNKGPLNKKDGVEIVNNNSESVDYVRLDDAQDNNKNKRCILTRSKSKQQSCHRRS
jgi:hypothetical protein